MRRGLVVAIAAIALGTLPAVWTSADAALVICQKGRKLRLRDGACVRKETQRDAAELGVTGPEGPTGAVGQQGPTGPTGPAAGPAGGALAGNYPDPTLAPGAITSTAAFADGAVPAVRVIRTTSSALTSFDQVEWHAEELDTANFFSPGSPTVLTAPVDGLYAISACVLLDTLSAGAWAQLRLLVDGAVQAGSSAHEFSNSMLLSTSTILRVNAGQTIFVDVGTDSTGAPNISSNPGFLSMHWVGPIP